VVVFAFVGLNFALADLGFTGRVWRVEGVSAAKVLVFCWASMAQT
jgi:hypothetical protein